MARKNEHDAAGFWIGFGVVFLTSRAATLGEALLEGVVGGCGGVGGSRLADAVEPPTHPGHRSVAHGVAANAGLAYVGVPRLARWRANPGGDRADRLASALAVGAAAGHASHLLLDTATPAGLPLIG